MVAEEEKHFHASLMDQLKTLDQQSQRLRLTRAKTNLSVRRENDEQIRAKAKNVSEALRTRESELKITVEESGKHKKLRKLDDLIQLKKQRGLVEENAEMGK